MEPERFILSGCSGGGKSTLLEALGACGYAIFREPGRRIVRDEQTSGGKALPWIDPEGFAARAISLALDDYHAASEVKGPVFFDRSMIDAISFTTNLCGHATAEEAALVANYRYATKVFLVPPWMEIFVNDPERQFGFDRAVEEYEQLQVAYAGYGYKTIILPKVSVPERVAIILKEIASSGPLEDPA